AQAVPPASCHLQLLLPTSSEEGDLPLLSQDTSTSSQRQNKPSSCARGATSCSSATASARSSASPEVVNTLCPDIEYLRIPVMDGPAAPKIHSVGTRGGWTLLRCSAGHQSASLAGAHAWVESCHPKIHPSNGFWQQLIHYEYKLFGVNRLQTVSSLSGMIPDVYENEVRVMLLL
uniref:Dual specificity phosphatase 21 n=1 Tax=Accipiter nisus TaxID=211598 RepID=A0A8B9MQH9_9AVES